MSHRRRRKNFNPINAPSLARWIVIFTFLAVTGLSYVYLSVQLHTLGTQRRNLERELSSVRTQNETASAQIDALTSRAALQRQWKEGYLKMIPIREESIVRLNFRARRPGEDELLPVANERGGQ